MDRLNEANLVLPGEEDAWVHMKPFSAAGTVGHKLLRNHGDIDEKVVEKDFPCMVEQTQTAVTCSSTEKRRR